MVFMVVVHDLVIKQQTVRIMFPLRAKVTRYAEMQEIREKCLSPDR